MYRWVKRMQCIYCVGIKHNLRFYCVLQPMWWFALAVATFVVVVLYGCLSDYVASPIAKGAAKLGYVPNPPC